MLVTVSVSNVKEKIIAVKIGYAIFAFFVLDRVFQSNIQHFWRGFVVPTEFEQNLAHDFKCNIGTSRQN